MSAWDEAQHDNALQMLCTSLSVKQTGSIKTRSLSLAQG